MADIAAHAGVSTATVSRVFNGVGQVSKETKLRVLTAIDQLGYERPSPEMHDAKPVIGIILPELTNPIFASYAHAFHTEISHAGGVAHIASQTPGTASEDAHIAAFINRGVSGLVFISGAPCRLSGGPQPLPRVDPALSPVRHNQRRPP